MTTQHQMNASVGIIKLRGLTAQAAMDIVRVTILPEFLKRIETLENQVLLLGLENKAHEDQIESLQQQLTSETECERGDDV